MEEADYNKEYSKSIRCGVFGEYHCLGYNLLDRTEYPCVSRKVAGKGTVELYDRLLWFGVCSRMNGCTENENRYRRVLLWIEPDCSIVHRIRVQQREKI